MKRVDLLRRLESYGCKLKREGESQSLWHNPRTGQIQSLPPHNVFGPALAKKICLGLSVPPM